jgi:hypothetical protein
MIIQQFHAGDKALTRETPAKRGRVNRYVCTWLGNINLLVPDLKHDRKARRSLA